MRPLAIIENGVAFGAEVRPAIESAGFHAEFYACANDALADLHHHVFALALVGLGNEDPFAICHEASRVVPVIAVAADCAEEVCVRAFESGADDCVVRGVAARELVARIRNVLRRAEEGDRDALGELSASVSTMRVNASGTAHDLTRGEAELLALLLEHAPRPLTPLEIAHMLRANRGTIESRIKTLRRKLGAERLVSRGRLGYQLV